MNKEDILEEALRITSGDRQAQYGPPDQDFARTAAMWSALFGDKLSSPFEARDVAMAMICLKLSRETHQRKRDNSVDGAGYFRCLHLCNEAAAVKEDTAPKDSMIERMIRAEQDAVLRDKTAPAGHRWVVKGEILREGDLYYSDYKDQWLRVTRPIGEPAREDGAYIRKIEESRAIGPNTNYVTVEKEQVRGVGSRTWLEVNIPDGLPPLPAPPDGYDVWVYRGLAWKCADAVPTVYWFPHNVNGNGWRSMSGASGICDTHYVEAIKQ